eukprot:XP_012811325.1 PREDICTED: group 3 secretory phospholipase A2 [Xenopus tropicalis]
MAARLVLGISVLLVALPIISNSVSGAKTGDRYKRGLTMPGTLWCGAGSSADNFTNLGIFNGADLCCREHDHCSHQIEAFQFQYGMRNYRLHTVSHCDCDQRFRLCLNAFNDTISTLVGIMFFNILEMPCFSLKEEEQCVEWFWWGGQTEAPSSFSTVFGGIAKKRRRLLKNKLQGYTIRGYQKFREGDTQKATERESLELPNKTNLIPKRVEEVPTANADRFPFEQRHQGRKAQQRRRGRASS